MIPHFRLPRSAKIVLLAVAAASLCPAVLPAADVKKEPSEKMSEELDKLKPLMADSKANADKILAEVTKLLGTVEKESMDRAILLQLVAQAYFNKNESAKAIAPMEEALQLADKYDLTPQPQRLQSVQYLAYLYQQEGSNSKDPAIQKQYLDKAYQYARRYLDGTASKPNPDFQLFAAYTLYTRASINPEKIDMDILKQAQAETEKGLRMSVKPKDTFYTLLLATLQQQGDFARSAELLELLVKQFPQNKMYWQQLAATYLQLGQDLRAAVTLERAHALNFLNEPAQNYNLVGIYYNLREYDQAAQLLEAWIRDGRVPGDQKNWELLATCYQQLHKEDKAIATLKEATTHFPKAGNLEQQIGQLYYSQDKFEEALQHLTLALKKGLDKPAPTYMFVAYLGFEMKRLDEALAAAEKAVQLAPNDKQAKQLLDSLKANVAEREAQKAAQIEKARKL
jgi:tetratricopeptide (TPR) repeat protein